MGKENPVQSSEELGSAPGTEFPVSLSFVVCKMEARVCPFGQLLGAALPKKDNVSNMGKAKFSSSHIFLSKKKRIKSSTYKDEH